MPSTQWELPSSSRGNIETEINENIENYSVSVSHALPAVLYSESVT